MTWSTSFIYCSLINSFRWRRNSQITTLVECSKHIKCSNSSSLKNAVFTFCGEVEQRRKSFAVTKTSMRLPEFVEERMCDHVNWRHAMRRHVDENSRHELYCVRRCRGFRQHLDNDTIAHALRLKSISLLKYPLNYNLKYNIVTKKLRTQR